MVLTGLLRRRSVPVAALFATVAVLLSSFPAPAFAQETDDEGGTRTLREQLDEAATAYNDAKGILDESAKRQAKLSVRLATLEDELDTLVTEVQDVAVAAYRTGRLGTFSALLNSGSTDAFLQRVAAVDMIAMREDEQLARLNRLTGSLERQRLLVQAEVDLQEREVTKLEEAKTKAERALFAVGGGASGNFVAYDSPDAKPASRNADGSFPAESCSEGDPTTSGCLTPRMLHALEEARLFGFTRYTACYRAGTWGEHPQGRACDMAAEANTFGGAAAGGDKTYGDRLASFFIHNASALGVMYVIWYRQIWFPGSGWSSYGGACGEPSCDHTNHVHISIQ